MNWQPIETAPKDGQAFVSWDGEQYDIVHFSGATRGWVGCDGTAKPTHWMPLLPLPAKETT